MATEYNHSCSFMQHKYSKLVLKTDVKVWGTHICKLQMIFSESETCAYVHFCIFKLFWKISIYFFIQLCFMPHFYPVKIFHLDHSNTWWEETGQTQQKSTGCCHAFPHMASHQGAYATLIGWVTEAQKHLNTPCKDHHITRIHGVYW